MLEVPPAYLLQLSSWGLFSVEGEQWMMTINLSFVMLDDTCCLSNLSVQSPGNIWCFRVKTFAVKYFDPNSPIASTINVGAGGQQDTAGWSTTVFNTHCLLKAAEYFQAQTVRCPCMWNQMQNWSLPQGTGILRRLS